MSELKHYGVKGMKWGKRKSSSLSGNQYDKTVRKYSKQMAKNDATNNSKANNKLIDKILKKYDTDLADRISSDVINSSETYDSRYSNRKQRYENRQIAKERRDARKRVSTMSDTELRERVNRLNMEQQYKKQVQTVPQQTMSKGKKFAMGAAVATATGLTLYANSSRIKDIVKPMVDTYRYNNFRG